MIIQDKKSSLSAQISPLYGGMVTQLTMCGKDILYLEKSKLCFSPFLAGGIPILFPFPSRTKNDSYELDGKRYNMPVHGFLKNSAFELIEADDSYAKLGFIGKKNASMELYPFDFELYISYAIKENKLMVSAEINNNSDERMPHYLGWHPFFISSDKSKLEFEHTMEYHYDYINCIDSKANSRLELWNNLDDVFHTAAPPKYVLKNHADGYVVKFTTDMMHDTLVVCSTLEGCVCIEPWCGVPDAINNGKLLKWIAPHQSHKCEFELEIDII